MRNLVINGVSALSVIIYSQIHVKDNKELLYYEKMVAAT